jgi:hypothetical protein
VIHDATGIDGERDAVDAGTVAIVYVLAAVSGEAFVQKSHAAVIDDGARDSDTDEG